MAITTLANARTELQARGYSRFTSGRLDQWLDDARVRFEDFPFDWPWLKATSTGAGPLTIADLRRVRSVMNTTTREPLTRMDQDAVLELVDATLTTTGTAAYWYLSAPTVVSTYPTTAALSVHYVKFSPALTVDGDAPLIPASYRLTWVDLAEVNVLRYGLKDYAGASALDSVVQGRLNEIANVYVMQDQPEFMETLQTGASSDG